MWIVILVAVLGQDCHDCDSPVSLLQLRGGDPTGGSNALVPTIKLLAQPTVGDDAADSEAPVGPGEAVRRNVEEILEEEMERTRRLIREATLLPANQTSLVGRAPARDAPAPDTAALVAQAPAAANATTSATAEPAAATADATAEPATAAADVTAEPATAAATAEPASAAADATAEPASAAADVTAAPATTAAETSVEPATAAADATAEPATASADVTAAPATAAADATAEPATAAADVTAAPATAAADAEAPAANGTAAEGASGAENAAADAAAANGTATEASGGAATAAGEAVAPAANGTVADATDFDEKSTTEGLPADPANIGAPVSPALADKLDHDLTPPPPNMTLVNQTASNFEKKFYDGNPLMEGTIWSHIGMPLVIASVVCGLFLLTCVHFSKPGHVVEQQLALPENMYGNMCATLVISSTRLKRNGMSLDVGTQLCSSFVLYALLFTVLYLLIGAAHHSIGEVQEDMEERDAAFEKFRNPAIWQTQDWSMYPDTEWRRMSMVWFCHDVIYGKAKHVVELGADWNIFSWVVLFIWISYMTAELRSCFNLAILTWSTKSAPMDAMVTMQQDDKIILRGLHKGIKVAITCIVILPKLAMNVYVAFIGCQFLMFNDLEDEMQEILLKTIELAFILEMDELIFMAFVSSEQKEQVRAVEVSPVRFQGFSAVLASFAELPRFVLLLLLVSCLTLYMHRDSHERMILTPKQEGVIEGCCNFMQYLKGEGQKVALAAGNPCSHFRESIEAPLGLTIPPTDGLEQEPVEEPLPEYETIINWKDTLAGTLRNWL